MSVSLAILILLILGTAAIWVFTQNKQMKSMLFPVVLIFLYILFWKIAGSVFAHFFLITGFLIVAVALLFPPDSKHESLIRLKFQLKYVLYLGTIALYTVVSSLVFIDAARQSGSSDFIHIILPPEFFDFMWIYIILLALFTIQLSILLKGIFKTDE